MKNRLYLSHILAHSHHAWKPGSQVYISAPTGTGKTTYILKCLLLQVMNHSEILYISNRITLHKQLVKEACKIFGISIEFFKDEKYAEFPGITFTTYQTLAEMLTVDLSFRNIPFFNYVVMDEVHFFLEDSEFNSKIQRLLRWKEQIQCDVEIYISATIEDILVEFGFWNTEWQTIYEDEIVTIRERWAHDIVRRLKGEKELLFYYSLPFEFPKYNISVYDDIIDVVDVINKDKSDEKWILFQSNKETARKLVARQIEANVAVVTAEDKECRAMKEIVENQRFDEKVLITTKVLDNGISIHDINVKNILLETTSKTEFIQMLGRRRIKDGEDVELNLFIPRLSAGYFRSLLFQKVKPMLELTECSQVQLMDKLMESDQNYRAVKALYDCIDGKFILNPLARQRLIEKKVYYERMIGLMEVNENAFVEEQLGWLGISVATHVQYLTEQVRKTNLKQLEAVLSSIAGEELSKQQQTEFRNSVKSILLELLPNKFPQKSRNPGLKVLNDCFESLGSAYRIVSKSGKKKGDETLWRVVKKSVLT